MADRFFVHGPIAPGEIMLTGDEAHHAVAVRRFGPGDRIVLFCGDGGEYPATILATAKKSLTLSVEPRIDANRETQHPIVIGAALPKGDRFDFLIEKLVELGTSRFVPLLAARSVVVPKSASMPKWRRAIIEASKQCGRNRLMLIDEPKVLTDYLADSTLSAAKVFFHTSSEPAAPDLSRSSAFAIGPEGGWTEAEVEQARSAGWKIVQHGPRVLRLETAAIAAAHWAMAEQLRSG